MNQAKRSESLLLSPRKMTRMLQCLVRVTRRLFLSINIKDAAKLLEKKYFLNILNFSLIYKFVKPGHPILIASIFLLLSLSFVDRRPFKVFSGLEDFSDIVNL